MPPGTRSCHARKSVDLFPGSPSKVSFPGFASDVSWRQEIFKSIFGNRPVVCESASGSSWVVPSVMGSNKTTNVSSQGTEALTCTEGSL